MGEKSRAVLDAADMWLAALDTIELLGERPSLQEKLGEAEANLAAAVKARRLPAEENGYCERMGPPAAHSTTRDMGDQLGHDPD